jgi:multidrug efflux pump subunit AcrB
MSSTPVQAQGEVGRTPAAPRRSRIADLATTASRHRAITLILLLAVVASGLWAYTVGLDRQGFPPIDTPIVIVQGGYVDAAGGQLVPQSAEAVDADVVLPLTDAFAGVEGVEATSSQAFPGGFAVIVEFEDGTASIDGSARLEALGVTLPPTAQVSYIPVEAASFVGQYDMLASVVGPQGATVQELQAQADKLAAILVTDDAVESAESRALLSEVVDPVTGQSVTATTRFTRVVLEPGGPYRDAVAVGLVQAEGSDLDVLEYSDRIQSLLVATPLADGFEAAITADFATSVRLQLGSLTSNLGTGLLAVALVSLLLIGWRVSLMTAGFMGVVMLGALVGLRFVGFSLNTITLFGLILTLGLLVDDAIVISESIDANRDDPDPEEDDERIGVIRTALARVGSASLSGTLTTVVVFSPLLFIGGILGEFIRPIPTTVIVTLLASFLFSISFIPMIARGFLLGHKTGNNPVVRATRALGAAAGRLAAYPSGNGVKGWIVGTSLALLSVISIGIGGAMAGQLGFSIFPTGKDAVSMLVTADFPAGTTFAQAEAVADEIDRDVMAILGDDLVGAQYTRGNERVIEMFIDLSPIDARDTTAVTFVAQLQEMVNKIPGGRITVAQAENGPPVEDFPFATQLEVSAATAEAGRVLADEIQQFLLGAELKIGSDTITITDALVSTDGAVARADGNRFVEVRAQFDDPASVTALTQQTQQLVEAEFTDRVVAAGLPAEALGFDFGFESDNQEDFAALGVVGLIAVGLMLVLLAVQFRSVAQSLLIFLAIPFSFLGVFTILSATDNPLSFLVAVGFVALIGVAVNNTILLVEAANHARRDGASAAEAIQEAVTRRFRPLVATTLTTVVGLLPLALSDPFWESLGFTLIGGLVSSTFLVLLSFPAYYLALEAVRTPLRNAARRRMGRPALT